MSPHVHKWMLGSVRPVSGKRLALVSYRCPGCGRRRIERNARKLVVETARYLAAKEVVR